MPLTISLLGPLEVRADGRPLPLGGSRLRTLLLRLALDAGRTVAVSALVDALWADEPPEGAANALQSLVSRVRRALGDPALVAATPGGYRLAIAPQDVDSVRFEALFREGREALRDDEPERARELLREALHLWRGPALADADGQPFAQAPATRLDELRLAALCDRLDADLRVGRHAEALAELEALAAEHPLRENIAALHVRALYGAGRQADALAVYEGVRAALADQLGIDPSKDLADLHLAVLRNDPSLAPAVSGAPKAPAPKTNLRTSLTSFVGREEEVRRIGKLLAESRLVTLVGPGGAGKTRLAAEAAARVAERFPDGVWLAELAPVTDPAEIATAVLVALGPRETRVMTASNPAAQVPARGALGHVLEQLADKRVLLILDNCEHLVGAAAETAETLLGQCPGLRIVATSREPLAILGETLYAVPPLGVPAEAPSFFGQPPLGTFDHRLNTEGLRNDHATRADPAGHGRHGGSGSSGGRGGSSGHSSNTKSTHVDDPTLPAPGTSADSGPDLILDALEFPAIRLFADRAAAVDPDFAVTTAVLPDVLRICRRLDGLPLAIELAAARLRTLPVHQISNRLGDRFRLLTGGSRTAMPRHQTLRAVVAWSWDLLSPAESDLAERLAVFPGGVTAEAAAAVLPEAAGYSEHEVFDLLSALVDKSLLQTVATEPDEPPRFRVLETIREYGAERLGEKVHDVRRAHARYFRDLAEEAEPHLRRAEQLQWIALLDRERDNILAALRFAADDGDADTAIRIAASFAWYWTLGDRTAEGRLLMRVALDAPGDSPPDKYAIVRALERVTSVFEDELWEEADKLERELREITAGLEGHDHPILALASVIGPMLADNQPGLDAAVEARIGHPDGWVRGMLMLMRGMSSENAGQRWRVRPDLEAARAEFEGVGDRWGLSAAVNGLATLAMADGDDEQALALQTEALELIKGINAFSDAAHIEMTSAMIMARLGRQEEALALLQAILESGHRSGSAMTTYSAMVGLAEFHRYVGDTATGWRYLRQSEAEASPGGPPQIMALRDVCAGMLHLAEGELDAGRERLSRSLGYGLVSRDMPVMSRVTIAVACFAQAAGDARGAARLLGLSEGLLGTADLGDPDRAPLVEKLRLSLSDEVYEACYAAGKTTPREEGGALLARSLGVPLDARAVAGPSR